MSRARPVRPKKRPPRRRGQEQHGEPWAGCSSTRFARGGAPMFLRNIFARCPRAALAERPQQPISRARSLAHPPLALPGFIGTSPSGILGFGGRQVAELGLLTGSATSFRLQPPRAARGSAVIGVSRFEFFFFRF